MTMNCHQELRDQLHPYLDGELEPERAAAVSRGLDECSDCRAEFDELQAVQLMARAAFEGPAAEVDLSHMVGGVMARLEAEGALRTAEAEREASPGLLDRIMALFTFEQPLMSLASAAALLAMGIGAFALMDTSEVESSQVATASPEAPAAPSVAEKRDIAPPIGKRRGPELESGRHAAFVEHVEAAKGRVVVDANTDDPSKPMVVWHHLDEGGALPIEEGGALPIDEGDGPGQQL